MILECIIGIYDQLNRIMMGIINELNSRYVIIHICYLSSSLLTSPSLENIFKIRIRSPTLVYSATELL